MSMHPLLSGWSTKEACYRQHGITTSSRCEKASYEDDLCYNHGVYLVDCVSCKPQ